MATDDPLDWDDTRPRAAHSDAHFLGGRVTQARLVTSADTWPPCQPPPTPSTHNRILFGHRRSSEGDALTNKPRSDEEHFPGSEM